MAIVPNFSSAESLAIPQNVTFTDTSTGSDGGLTIRKIFVRLANGNWLTANGESTTIVSTDWPIADSSITISLLTQSTTASVNVIWYTGAAETNTKTILMEWDLFDYLFAFGLIQNQTANPTIISDTNYYGNFFRFITNIWNSESAVVYGNDLYSSQAALNVNQNMINNSQLYF